MKAKLLSKDSTQQRKNQNYAMMIRTKKQLDASQYLKFCNIQIVNLGKSCHPGSKCCLNSEAF